MFAGVDIGSVSTKAVIVNEHNDILAFSLLPTSYDRQKCGEDALEQALNAVKKSPDNLKYIVSTGYGRRAFPLADKTLPEIICHAKGTYFLIPSAKTIIDIGGQDSKIIELDGNGGVTRFEMNDKCAAGTGRFLEVLTERILNIPIDELGPTSLKARDPCILTSVCTVFAETEIVSLLSEKRKIEDIACGMHKAIAKRVISMGTAGQIKYHEPVVFSGGVAKNIGVVKAIKEELAKTVIALDEPQITAALGAAIIARENNKPTD